MSKISIRFYNDREVRSVWDELRPTTQITMKEEGKTYYEAPATTVVEVKIEGVVCESPVKGGNSINNWQDGGTINDDIYM